MLSVLIVKPNSLSINTAPLAGFVLILEISPPKAPKAPPIDSNLAVPIGFSKEILKISLKVWDLIINEDDINIKINNFLTICKLQTI